MSSVAAEAVQKQRSVFRERLDLRKGAGLAVAVVTLVLFAIN